MRLTLTLVAGMTLGCDQGTKYMASSLLANQPGHSFFGNVFRLVYAENTGGFLSLGADLPPPLRTALFVFCTGAALALFAFFLFRAGRPPGQMAGLTLLLAGGISNWADRVFRGSVVDFMNVGLGSVRTGIFNVADMAILAGVALLIRPALRRAPAGK